MPGSSLRRPAESSDWGWPSSGRWPACTLQNEELVQFYTKEDSLELYGEIWVFYILWTVDIKFWNIQTVFMIRRPQKTKWLELDYQTKQTERTKKEIISNVCLIFAIQNIFGVFHEILLNKYTLLVDSTKSLYDSFCFRLKQRIQA